MNKLCQGEDFLLGDQKSVLSLAESQTSTILIISDSHGAFYTLAAILKEFGSQSDALVFCGDGMSDLTACFEESVYEKSFSNL